MNSDQKILSTLGLCRKAGKLITGFDAVTGELKNGSGAVKGVIIAQDLSQKTKKELRFFCEKAGVPLSQPDVTLDELSRVLGKKTGIVGVLDEGFYNSISKLALLKRDL